MQSPGKPLAVKSKAVKPCSTSQKAPEQLPNIPEQGLLQALHAHLQAQPGVCTGLLGLAPARPWATGAADPQMPEPLTGERASGSLVDKEAATTEIYLQEEAQQSGTVDADLALLSEQRAMQVVHRFQKLSMLALEQPDVQPDEQPDALPPVAPPTSLYAMLPQEWPLARLSAQLRHIGVLLRATDVSLSWALGALLFTYCHVRLCERCAETLMASVARWQTSWHPVRIPPTRTNR